MSFRAKWAIEPGQDFLQVQGSANGFSYEPLCGRYTKPGTIFQIPDKPVYDGFQNEWILEVIDLKDFLGGNFFAEFSLHSDLSVEYEGFFIDDIRIISFESGSSTKDFKASGVVKAYPNPANELLYFDIGNNIMPQTATGSVSLFNLLGVRVHLTQFSSPEALLSGIDIKNLAPGVYTYRIAFEGGLNFSGKITVLR